MIGRLRPICGGGFIFVFVWFRQANLIYTDINSAISDAKGGKVKKRPEALK